jgi:hypothetical protein
MALTKETTFFNKSGQNSVAWSLISTAARMCIDLGWHRLPRITTRSDISKEHKVFWHIFIMDSVMAFNRGRGPTIQRTDIAERPTIHSVPDYMPRALAQYVVPVFPKQLAWADFQQRLYRLS